MSNFRLSVPLRSALLLTSLLFALAVPGICGPINIGVWYQFSFADVGDPATGCNPADPGGAFCIPSSGTPSTFLDAPPWTFTAPSTGGFLTVVDSFASVDQFEIFNFGNSIGVTSAPVPGSDCGDDPVPCLADPDVSKLVLALAPGNYSLSLSAVEGGFGSGFLRVDPVPEPASMLLAAAGLFICVMTRKQRNKRIKGAPLS